ncbi:ABC transporter permease [Tindallia californiensis]|uniref:Transport permease protein n=1 Tax=Tindallia californiensis TaxID=159292 RepID=A0A1H3PCX1_9FIRM|nr:ABC transporter permease [Tindallia californiensis]SDY98911.1 ABC-2 type transport system permease protein/lipopolysaccharide transport system permease protein [Tindallia californiensis]
MTICTDNKLIRYLKTFKKYYFLLTVLVKTAIEKKYKGSALGIVWSLLNPLLHMIVLSIVFSTLLQRQIENFPLYILTGRLVFAFFSTCTSTAMKSITASGRLITKVYIPKYIITLSKVISEFIFFIVSMFNLVFVILWTGASFSIHLIYVPIYLILLFILVMGVSLLLATVAVFFRDMEHIYSVIIMMMMYLSAIFYPPEIVPDQYQIFLQINPVFHFIQGFRQIIYYNATPEVGNLLFCAGYALFFMIAGLFLFERNQKKFIFYI